MFDVHVAMLLAERDALMQANAQRGAAVVHDVVVRIGNAAGASLEFVPGLDPWTWHATFTALYERDDAAVSRLTYMQYFRHRIAGDDPGKTYFLVEAVSPDGTSRWARTTVRSQHTDPGPGQGALEVLLLTETPYAVTEYGRLAAKNRRNGQDQELEEHRVRSVRLAASPWRIDFMHVSRHWPLNPFKASRETYEIMLIWDPPPPSRHHAGAAATPPSQSLAATLALLQTAAAASARDLNDIIAEHITIFEQTKSYS